MADRYFDRVIKFGVGGLILAALVASGGTRAQVPSRAGHYPAPEKPTPIDLPGLLAVGAEYCSHGICKTVGDDIVGFTVRGTPIGGVQGCSMMPKAPACISGRLPVQVEAEYSNGSAVVRINGDKILIRGDQVIVLYRGYEIPLNDYRFCFPTSGQTSTAIGADPCIRYGAPMRVGP